MNVKAARNPDLSLHVGQLLRHSAVPYTEQIDASDVAGLAVANPVVDPLHDTPIGRRKHILGIEAGMRRAGKELFPIATNRSLTDESRAIRCRPGVLEHAIWRHMSHNGVDVMAIEGIVELGDDGTGFFGCHGRDVPNKVS